MIGTKLAHYEITSHLGSGGMGDVYQATDIKLRRSVAIKFLPEEFSHQDERLARFRREARVLASLNHPNIAGIYGVEEIDGRHFLVMELVPGETLADRVRRSAVPIEEALPIVKQLAEALEEAHEKGIVHRDLKPANIKLTPDSTIKVLDFGLATACDAEPSNTNFSQSPTLSMGATNAGVILGTAAYMSPEQAKGLPVDRRTDIFAFGAVLYEMLTGRAAFPGETTSDILAAVLMTEPDWSKLPEAVPVSIRRLMQRCLQKDRKRRLQAAGDARFEIEEAFSEGDAKEFRVEEFATGKRERVPWTMAIVSSVAALVFGFLAFQLPARGPEVRLEVTTPATDDPTSFALSPDGRRLVFVASGGGDSRLWLRPLDAMTAQPLPGTESAVSPFFSADGMSVGFFASGKLKRVDVGGGPPVTLADAPFGRGGTWNSDGTILFAPALRSALFRIAGTGGEPTAVTKSVSGIGHEYPQFLPDKRRFIFFMRSNAADESGIYLGTLNSPEVKRLAVTASPGLYTSEGWLFYLRQQSLVAQHLDLTQGKFTGQPINVATPIDSNGPKVASFSVAATGTLAYRASSVARRQLVWFDRTGVMLGAIAAPDANDLFDPTLSPGARRVAVTRNVENNKHVWLLDALRVTRLTDVGIDGSPIWSPDGKRVIFLSNRTGTSDLYQRRLNAESDDLLIHSSETKIPNSFTQDGRFLLYTSTSSAVGGVGTSADLMVLLLDGSAKPRPFLNSRFDERYGQFSPDGRWVAYQSNESGDGEYQIYVKSFPAPGERLQISSAGGIQPRWRPDGKELYYVAADGRLMAVPIAGSETTLTPGTPIPLFQPRIHGGGNAANFFLQQYDVSKDGHFLVNVNVGEAVASPITLILNWTPKSQ